MTIEELNTFNAQEYKELAELMNILDSSCHLTEEQLEETVTAPASHLYVMRHEGHIIGCYTLGLFHSPTGRKASVEDVVVHTDYQGQHLGKLLIGHAINQLRQWAPIHVQLTSRPHRVAANALYKSVGFLPKDTNVYVMNL